MSQPDDRFEVEALLAEQGFLNALARSLVGDPYQADDLVQDTLAAALEHTPPIRGGIRPWISRVLRNRLARQGAREAERRDRERASQPGPDRLEEARSSTDPARLEAALETRRQVAAAVRDLPEPQRSAVYLRYYEGLDLSAIAEREGAPVATIKTRIRRGLDLVREQLDRQFGSRGAWATLLIPRGEVVAVPADGRRRRAESRTGSQTERSGGPTPSVPLPRFLGGSLVPVIAGAALLIGGILVSRVLDPVDAGTPRALAPSDRSDDNTGRELEVPSRSARLGADAGEPEGSKPGKASLLANDETRAEEEPDPGPTHDSATFRFDGSVSYPGGGPVEGARIYHGALVATSDENGRFSFEEELWLIDGGRAVTSTWIPLFAVKPGYQPALIDRFTMTFDPRQTRQRQVDLALPGPVLSIEGQVLDAAGLPAPGWKVAIRNPTPALRPDRKVRRKQSIEQVCAGRDVIVDTDGDGHFRIDGLVDREYDLVAWEPASLIHVRREAVRAGIHGLTLQIPQSATLRPIRGTVRTAHGKPVADVQVQASLVVTDDWEHLSGRRSAHSEPTRSAGDGSFELGACTSQTVSLSAEEPGVVMLPTEFWPLEEGAPAEQVVLEVGLRCEVQFEARGSAPLPDLLVLLDGEGRQLLLEMPEDDPLHEQLAWWPSLPTEGRRTFRFFASGKARHLVLRNWNREEVVRMPIELHHDRPNRIEW